MKFIKRLIILTGPSAKGTLTLEKNAFGIWLKLNTFNLPQRSGYELAVISAGEIFVVKTDDGAKASVDLPLKDVETLHAAVLYGGKVELYGTTSPKRMAIGTVEEMFARKKFGGKNSAAAQTDFRQTKTNIDENMGSLYSERKAGDYFFDIVPKSGENPELDERSDALRGLYSKQSSPIAASSDKQNKNEPPHNQTGNAFYGNQNRDESPRNQTEDLPRNQTGNEFYDKQTEDLTCGGNAFSGNAEEAAQYKDDAIAEENYFEKEKDFVFKRTTDIGDSTDKANGQAGDYTQTEEQNAAEGSADDHYDLRGEYDEREDGSDGDFAEKEFEEDFYEEGEDAYEKAAEPKRILRGNMQTEHKYVSMIFNKHRKHSDDKVFKAGGTKASLTQNKGDAQKEIAAASSEIFDMNKLKNGLTENAWHTESFYDARRKASFYERNKDEIDNLFRTNARFTTLERIIPDSKWVKIDYDDSGRYYVVGMTDDYLCYGVPGRYSAEAPEEFKGYCQWLPVNENDPLGEGFWVMFQDLADGTTVKID